MLSINEMRDTMYANTITLVNDICETMNLDKNSLSEQNILDIVSIMGNILNGNKIFNLGNVTKEDIRRLNIKNIDDLIYSFYNILVFNSKINNFNGSLEKETSNTFRNYYKWESSYKNRKCCQGREVKQEEVKIYKDYSKLENEIVVLKETIKKLKIENQKLKNEIENLNKNSIDKKRNFSNSQIQSIKNMNTHGISTRLIAMEFNCSIEDIKNVIDE